MNLKVLPLEEWMTWSNDITKLEKMMPRQKRDGYYLLGDSCWIEVGHKAYIYKKEYFQYSLDLLNHRVLRDNEYKAINYLIKNKLADRRLKKLYWMEEDVRVQRQVALNAKKWKLRV